MVHTLDHSLDYISYKLEFVKCCMRDLINAYIIVKYIRMLHEGSF